MNYELKRLPTIGDGNCLFHAILQCCSKEYCSKNDKDKRKIAKTLRKILAEILGKHPPNSNKTYYDLLAKGEMKKLGEDWNEASFAHLKNKFDSNCWGDYYMIEHISNQLELDIYIFSDTVGGLYPLGGCYHGRDSIILYNTGNVHFESMSHNDHTLFSADSAIIKSLRSKMESISS